MEQMISAINPDETDSLSDGEARLRLQTAAKVWASYALDTYSGKRLTAALGISVAISRYTAILEKEGGGDG